MATACDAQAGIGRDNGHEIDVAGLDLMNLPDDFVSEAYQYFAALRAASAIDRNSDGSFMATHDDVLVSVYRDPSVGSSDKKIDFKPKLANSPLYEHRTTSIVFRDPPDHTRIGTLFQAALLASAISPGPRTIGV